MIWRKVWRDLWTNKLRTILVVLAIAVGVFALGLVFGLSGVMSAAMTSSHKASNAPHLEIYPDLFDQEVVDAIRSKEGVAEAEGERRSGFRWKLPGDEEWQDGTVIARSDYDDQYMYPVSLLEGEWPSHRTLAVERMSADWYDLPIGTEIIVEVGRWERSLPIEGIVRHPYTPPPQIGLGNATFAADSETIAWLLDSQEGFDTLNVRLERYSEDEVEAAGEWLTDELEKMGMSVYFWDTIDPERHWAQDIIDTVFVILGVLGGLSLVLSGFMIINVMNATVVQQVWQIGVLKVIGATVGRVVQVYLAVALIYGLLGLVVAVPLGALGAHLMAVWMLDLFNIVAEGFTVEPTAVLLQSVMGIVVPVVAAFIPVMGGARISAHKAISSHGLGGSFGSGWLDRLIGRIRSLPRPLALSLRNTFRRKARVALTMFTLVLGGVMFIMVLSVSASFSNTIEVLLNDFGFDVLAGFGRLYRVPQLLEVGQQVPGVAAVEAWDRWEAQLALPDESGAELDVGVWGVPDNSVMFNPRIVAGRELQADDGRAILLNNKIANEHNFQVGDTIQLTILGRETEWTIVGLLININNDYKDNFVPFDSLGRVSGNSNRAGLIMVAGDERYGAGNQKELLDRLREAYAERHMEFASSQSGDEVRQQNLATFDVITNLMLAMAILAAVVGSAGLMSTMSINVVERGREIGMMRSIGATSLSIGGIFVIEGVLIGILSWLIAIPLSVPGSRAFSDVVGMQLVEIPLDFKYPLDALVLWFVIVLVLSAIASLWPALRATRVSVRESLAYE